MRAYELVKKVLNKKSTDFVTRWQKKGIIILDKNRQVLIEETIRAMIEHSKIEEAFTVNEYFENQYDYLLRYFERPDVLISVQDQVRAMQTSGKESFKKNEKDLLNQETGKSEISAYDAAVQALQSLQETPSFLERDIPERKMTYTEVQIEKILVETKIKEIELNLKLNELIPKQTAFKIYETLIFEVKANLRTVPSQIADRLLRLKTIPEVVEVLTIAIDNVLSGLIDKNESK